MPFSAGALSLEFAISSDELEVYQRDSPVPLLPLAVVHKFEQLLHLAFLLLLLAVVLSYLERLLHRLSSGYQRVQVAYCWILLVSLRLLLGL